MNILDILKARKLGSKGYVTLHNPTDMILAKKFSSVPTEIVTVTGNPIAITDAKRGLAKSLKVDLEPIQDLNGYDSPWVGGGGKNKLPFDLATMKVLNSVGTWVDSKYTVDNVEVTINNDGTIKLNGTPSGVFLFRIATFNVVNGNTYILSGSPTGAGTSSYRIDGRSNNVVYESWNDANSDTLIATENVTLTMTIRTAANYTLNNVIIKPMICLSTATNPREFAPYSNICPISGRTQTTVKRYGKNLFDIRAFVNNSPVKQRCTVSVADDDTVTVTGTQTGGAWIGFAVNVGGTLPTGTFTIPAKVGDKFAPSGMAVYFYECDDNDKILSFTQTNIGSYYTVTDSNCKKLAFRIILGSLTVGDTVSFKEQVEVGETATPYESYITPIDTTVQFGQTVYGGEVKSQGGTDSEYSYFTIDSNTNLSGAVTSAYGTYSNITNIPKGLIKNDEVCVISDKCVGISYNNRVSGYNDKNRVYVDNSGNVVIRTSIDESVTTVEQMKSLFNGFSFCYKVDTPTEISTPAFDIPLNKGNNTLTADGDMELKYKKEV